MRHYSFITCFSVVLMYSMARSVLATEISAYELTYNEQEPGTDIYRVRFSVSDNYVRIDDESGEDTGYIVYEHSKKTIYSVSHFDKTILVIPNYEYKKPDIGSSVKVKYNALTDAPKISGKTVYNYAVHAESEKCMDIQLVPEFMPHITKILKSYQRVLAGQQVKMLKTTPLELQTACFLYDQVYNDGQYYEKGFPIQEWHSNGKQRVLTAYKEIKVDSNIYNLPDDYRKYSLD